MLEYPIHGDVALIKAEQGDRWGNLTYRMSARNFGPVMATAAKTTIATVHEVVELGALDPEAIVTPGIYVTHVVKIDRTATQAGGFKSREIRMKLASTAQGISVSSYQKRSKEELAKRVAQDIHDGAYVNLGIGQPTLVANHIPAGREVILQSENGILGMGPAPAAGLEDYDLINAGKQPVTLLPGGAYFHHADSFAMMRGGHLDICVLGAFQVSATGDLANWSTGEPGAIPAVGGAMDLAIGAKQTWVMMDLLTKQGASKIVTQCTYPLTGVACVKRIYTDLCTLACTPTGLQLIDTVPGLQLPELEQLAGLPIRAAAV